MGLRQVELWSWARELPNPGIYVAKSEPKTPVPAMLAPNVGACFPPFFGQIFGIFDDISVEHAEGAAGKL